MSGLKNIFGTNNTIIAENLMENFRYIENLVSVVASDSSFVNKVSLSEELRTAVKEALSVDTAVFLPNLGDMLAAIDTFVDKVVNAKFSEDGFNGLAFNQSFADLISSTLYYTQGFWGNFTHYLVENENILSDYFDSAVFKGSYTENSDSFPFGSAIRLIDVSEPVLDVASVPDAPKYMGITIEAQESVLSSAGINFYVSTNQLFPEAQSPGTPGVETLRFTMYGQDTAGGIGAVAGSFFETDSGFQILNISSLNWNGSDPLYAKVTSGNTSLGYISIYFDYARSQGQITLPSAGGKKVAYRYEVKSHKELVTLFGEKDDPAAATYGGYNSVTGRIEWPEGLRVVLEPPAPENASPGWEESTQGVPGYVFYNPIYLNSWNNIRLSDGVVLIKGSKEAKFIVKSLENTGIGSHASEEDTEISVAGITLKAGDRIIYYDNSVGFSGEIYSVLKVDGVKVQLDRYVGWYSNGGVGVALKVPHNIVIEGGTVDGRGGIYDVAGSYGIPPAPHFTEVRSSLFDGKIPADFGRSINYTNTSTQNWGPDNMNTTAYFVVDLSPGIKVLTRRSEDAGNYGLFSVWDYSDNELHAEVSFSESEAVIWHHPLKISDDEIIIFYQGAVSRNKLKWVTYKVSATSVILQHRGILQDYAMSGDYTQVSEFAQGCLNSSRIFYDETCKMFSMFYSDLNSENVPLYWSGSDITVKLIAFTFSSDRSSLRVTSNYSYPDKLVNILFQASTHLLADVASLGGGKFVLTTRCVINSSGGQYRVVVVEMYNPVLTNTGDDAGTPDPILGYWILRVLADIGEEDLALPGFFASIRSGAFNYYKFDKFDWMNKDSFNLPVVVDSAGRIFITYRKGEVDPDLAIAELEYIHNPATDIQYWVQGVDYKQSDLVIHTIGATELLAVWRCKQDNLSSVQNKPYVNDANWEAIYEIDSPPTIGILNTKVSTNLFKIKPGNYTPYSSNWASSINASFSYVLSAVKSQDDRIFFLMYSYMKTAVNLHAAKITSHELNLSDFSTLSTVVHADTSPVSNPYLVLGYKVWYPDKPDIRITPAGTIAVCDNLEVSSGAVVPEIDRGGLVEVIEGADLKITSKVLNCSAMYGGMVYAEKALNINISDAEACFALRGGVVYGGYGVTVLSSFTAALFGEGHVVNLAKDVFVEARRVPATGVLVSNSTHVIAHNYDKGEFEQDGNLKLYGSIETSGDMTGRYAKFETLYVKRILSFNSYVDFPLGITTPVVTADIFKLRNNTSFKFEGLVKTNALEVLGVSNLSSGSVMIPSNDHFGPPNSNPRFAAAVARGLEVETLGTDIYTSLLNLWEAHNPDLAGFENPWWGHYRGIRNVCRYYDQGGGIDINGFIAACQLFSTRTQQIGGSFFNAVFLEGDFSVAGDYMVAGSPQKEEGTAGDWDVLCNAPGKTVNVYALRVTPSKLHVLFRYVSGSSIKCGEVILTRAWGSFNCIVSCSAHY